MGKRKMGVRCNIEDFPRIHLCGTIFNIHIMMARDDDFEEYF